MNVDDLFGVALLFVSVLVILFFMISLVRKETIIARQKTQANNPKSKFGTRYL